MTNDYNIENMKRLTPTIDQVIHQAEIMGYDTSDPDFMAGPFRKLFKRIVTRVRERRAKRKAGGGGGNYSVSTPAGSISYSQQGGLQFLNPQTGQIENRTVPGMPGTMNQSMMPSGQNINIPGLGNVPLIAVVGVPLLLFAIMNKKKKK
ncbi:hypothetical protein GQ473_06060 [archaeon]|nr:hypothetical protein [archaeon]